MNASGWSESRWPRIGAQTRRRGASQVTKSLTRAGEVSQPRAEPGRMVRCSGKVLGVGSSSKGAEPRVDLLASGGLGDGVDPVTNPLQHGDVAGHRRALPPRG